jgi:hypothetical protein
MSVPGPRLIGYNIAYSMYEYLERLIELGLVEGPLGKMDLNPKAKPLVDALHQVLAGGTVTVQVTTPGNPQILAELAATLQEATNDGNAINKAVGFYLTAAP